MTDAEHLALIDVTAPIPGECVPTLDDYSRALAIIHAREDLAPETVNVSEIRGKRWMSTGPALGPRQGLQQALGQQAAVAAAVASPDGSSYAGLLGSMRVPASAHHPANIVYRPLGDIGQAGNRPAASWVDRQDAEDGETFQQFKARRERELYGGQQR